jgi:hypothetical protein
MQFLAIVALTYPCDLDVLIYPSGLVDIIVAFVYGHGIQFRAIVA